MTLVDGFWPVLRCTVPGCPNRPDGATGCALAVVKVRQTNGGGKTYEFTPPPPGACEAARRDIARGFKVAPPETAPRKEPRRP